MSQSEAFADWLQRNTLQVEEHLATLLSQIQMPPPLAAAMKDSVLTGGKRLRPAVLFAVAEQDNTLTQSALAAACAVELIHCYSLVHDDMPCMDDGDLRRGKPACHKAHGEGMALLAGDCLQSLAFETLAGSALPLAAVHWLAHAAGGAGMGGGQALDIADAAADEEQLEAMHRLKTGALFDCALQLGLLCRHDAADARHTQAVAAFSREFGLLFQIANDLRDEQQDRRAGKPTYATLLAPAQAKQRALAAKQQALAVVERLFPRLGDITHAVYP